MKIKIIIYNIFSFIRNILQDLINFLLNSADSLRSGIFENIFDILTILILSPLFIIVFIFKIIIYLIDLLDATFYYSPSRLRSFMKRQRQIIKNQRDYIENLEKKLNEK